MEAIRQTKHIASWSVWPVALRCIGVIIAVELFFTGLWVRQQVWQACAQIHYQGDLEQAHRHGNRIIRAAIDSELGATQATVPRWSSVFRAYLNYYDQIIADRPDGQLELDYPPLRLLVMSMWSRLIYVPGLEVEDYDINLYAQPLLQLNICAEILAAIAAFLLVRYWVAAEQPLGSKSDRPWMCGLAAAALIWFDPALLVDAHGWPQWDAWVVPFYLFAAWTASTNRWFIAGLILAIGGAAKGQLWVTAPVLLLWPIFAWRWGGFLRILFGLAFGVACIQAIWTLSIPSAQMWIGACAIAMFVVVAMLLTVSKLPLRAMAMACCVLLVGAIFFATVRYDASFGWFKVGIIYGASKNERHMFAGVTNNLPAILTERYGWSSPNDNLTTITIHGSDYPITIGNLLQGMYGVSIVLCAAGLAMHSHRRSARTLLALAAPWVLFYALMPQMRERYLMWGGVISAIAIGVGLGPALLHIVISLFAVDTILHIMMGVNPDSQSNWVYTLLQGMHPDSGWAVLLCAAIFLFWAVVPQPQARHS